MRLTRSTLGIVVIALLAVTGLGLTAATLTTSYSSSVAPGNAGSGVEDADATDPDIDPDDDDGEGWAGGGGEGQDPLEIPSRCIEILTQPAGILGLVAGFALLVGASYWRRGFVAAALSGYLVGLPMILSYGLLTQCPGGSEGGGSGSALTEFVTGSGMADSLTTTVPAVVVGAMVLLAVIGAVAALVMVGGDEEIQPEPTEDDEEPGLEEFGAVAGDAADSIESTDASVDNAVYRAWREMTDLLAIDDPETTTPGQFEAAAVEAGLDDDHVGDLTRLFEEVRYGEMDPEPRADLAVETLRHIEETYTTDENTSEPEEEDR